MTESWAGWRADRHIRLVLWRVHVGEDAGKDAGGVRRGRRGGRLRHSDADRLAGGQGTFADAGGVLSLSQLAARTGLALGTVHHRSTVEFSEETLADAAGLWDRLSGAVTRALELAGGVVDAPSEEIRSRALPEEYSSAMDDDLNLAGAMAVVHATLKRLNTALSASDASASAELALDLRAQLDVLGLDPLAEPWRSRVIGAGAGASDDAALEALDHLVSALIDERAQARAAKDWARADALRDQLTAAGVVVEDSATGARWHLA